MVLKSLIFCFFVAINFISGLEVGDSSVSKKEDGICACVLFNDCEVARRDVLTKGFHNLARCGFQDDTEIVCCPSVSKQQTTPVHPPALKPKGGTKNVRVAERECNKIIDAVSPPSGLYIIGGETAEQGEFPHMVALGYNIFGTYVFRCGGSLISNRYVMTAAHCVKTIDREQPRFVRMGVVNITGKSWNSATDIEVERIDVHPDHARPQKYNDLALIRLAKPVEYSRTVFPACLYTNEADPTVPLVVSGWGTTNITRTAQSNVLLKATLRAVPRETCNLKYSLPQKLPNGIVSEQVCAGDAAGAKDTCQGDSGGPLQGLTGSDGHYRIVGVTSYGSTCGSSVPGIYTRVAKYLDWIEGIVWPTN